MNQSTDQQTNRQMGAEQRHDEELWRIAKARVGFKWSFASYCIVNAMLVAIWYFTSGPFTYFWPIWPVMGWGICIAFQYFHAYHGNTLTSTEREYERLKKERESR